MRKAKNICLLLMLTFALLLSGNAAVYATEISAVQSDEAEGITVEMDTVERTDVADVEEVELIKKSEYIADDSDTVNANGYDAICLDIDYPFVGETFKVGEELQIHFVLFSYGEIINQKYYVNIYNEANEIVASRSDYFPSSFKTTDLILTWTPKVSPGKYYVEFYSTYVTDYKGISFRFNLAARDGEYFTCVESGSQKAVTNNLSRPLSAWKKTSGCYTENSGAKEFPFEIQLMEMYVGDTAAYIVKDENSYNDTPTSSQQWILMKYYLKNNGSSLLSASDIVFNSNFFKSNGSSIRIIRTASFAGERRGMGIFDIDFYGGGDGYVWYGMLVEKADGYPYLRIPNGYNKEEYGWNISWLTTDPSSYKITYNLDGGKNHKDNPDSYKVTSEFSLKNPTKTGYKFAGWYSDSSFKKKVTKISYGTKGNKKFYAKWTANKYTVAFNGNKATSGKMSSMTSRKYGTSYKLTANAFKRKGYTFTGWNTKADGSGKSYKDKASVKNLASKNGATVTLYAQWEKTKYTISYNLNGGKNHADNPAKYTITTSTFKLKNPTKAGYTFKGWYAESSFKNQVTEIKKGSTGTKKVYAKWSENKYTIKFNGNGATSGAVSSMKDRKYASKYTLYTNKFKRTGYTFTGWNTKADGSGKAYKDKASVSKLASKNGATVTLYAQWETNKYNITYVLDGGKNHSDNPSKYSIKTSTIKLKSPTKTGYTFAGWYSDSKFENKVTEIKKGSTGSKKLYAKWTENRYTIKFNGNGAKSGAVSSMKDRKYSSTYTLNANKYERPGFTFTGWNTKADGSGKAYADKAEVNKLASKNGATVTLYAQWDAITYTVTYELNGGKNDSENPTEFSAANPVVLKNATRNGYHFAGWYLDEAFEIQVTELTEGIVGDITLYAKWELLQYHIAFDGNGATEGAMDTLNGCKFGENIVLPANTYTRVGYDFVGWNTKADGTGAYLEDGAEVLNLTTKHDSVVTLYAQWNPHTYYIQFDGNGASGYMLEQACLYDLSCSLRANTFVRPGYKFVGWNTKANGTGDFYEDCEYVSNLTPENNAEITLYAQWTLE